MGDVRLPKVNGRAGSIFYILSIILCMGLLALGCFDSWFYVPPTIQHGQQYYFLATFYFPSPRISHICANAVFADQHAQTPIRFERRGCKDEDGEPTSEFWNDPMIQNATRLHRADDNGIDVYIKISLGFATAALTIASVCYLVFLMNIFTFSWMPTYGPLFAAAGHITVSFIMLPFSIFTLRAAFQGFGTHPIVHELSNNSNTPAAILKSKGLMGTGRDAVGWAGLMGCCVILFGLISAFIGIRRYRQMSRRRQVAQQFPFKYHRLLESFHKECERTHSCENEPNGSEMDVPRRITRHRPTGARQMASNAKELKGADGSK